MPSRVLRDWTDSLPLDGISADAERLLVRLIMKADDYGRFHAEPRLVRAGCFPLTDNLRTNDLARWLTELSTRQLILRYEVKGRQLLAIISFRQRLKMSRAKFPAPDGKPTEYLPESDDFREVPGSSGKFPPDSVLDPDSVPDPSLDPAGGAAEKEEFAKFWSAYPRKEGKGKAEDSWKTHKCAPLLATILAAIERYKATPQWKRDAGQFIPMPATWLNQKRWEDEPLLAGGAGIREHIKPNIITGDDE